MTTFEQLFGDESDPLSQAFDPQPLVLEGPSIRLEPLTLDHAEELYEAGKISTLWRNLPVKAPKNVADMRAWIQVGIDEMEAGRAVAFATIHKEENKAVGSTRFQSITREHRGVEIGWTWIGINYQRTAVNTQAKFLMLKQAFEKWGAIRVFLKTDSRNRQSRAAIERIGARREGVLRNHMIRPDGEYRDSVVYSITRKEWPEKKKSLEMRML